MLVLNSWACGVILFTLLAGSPPFWHRKQMLMLRMIMEGRYQFSSPEWDDRSDTVKDLVSNPDFDHRFPFYVKIMFQNYQICDVIIEFPCHITRKFLNCFPKFFNKNLKSLARKMRAVGIIGSQMCNNFNNLLQCV